MAKAFEAPSTSAVRARASFETETGLAASTPS